MGGLFTFGTLMLITALVPVPAAAQTDRDVSISTSNAIDYARMIARDEGFDISDTSLYTFEQLDFHQPGYMALGFDVNVHPQNLILINRSTGQAIDYNTCEIFDYPDLQGFQERIISITKVKRKTPKELANDIGCSPPKIRSKPRSLVK